jgi:excinuclease ABC subunit A
MIQNNVIKVCGARTHNLKNINIDLPLNKIICISGPSGSGKSSLAFHTLLTESKRRFINSLPTDMKFFWETPHTVDVDSIYPVLPAWGLPQYNPVINSRPVAADILGAHERLQRVFFELGRNICPVHQEELKKSLTLQVMIKKLNAMNLQDDDVVHVFCRSNDYRHFVSKDFFPNRSYADEVRDFVESDNWYELFRVKPKNIEDIKKKFSETKLEGKVEVLIATLKSKKSFTFINEIVFKCDHCDYSLMRSKALSPEALSPLNALGACQNCEGHGALLIYDREKLVKDPTKSIKDGAINFLNFSHFQHLYPIFLKEVKKEGFDINIPFNQHPKTIWKFLYDGNGKYEGFNEYFEYLKTQRYKKNIRIYMRSMQSEVKCQECDGTRVSTEAGGVSLVLKDEVISFRHLLSLDFNETLVVLKKIKKELKSIIENEKMNNSINKLTSLYEVAIDLGLGHLQNTRKVRSMSSSEYQRLLLTKYFAYEGSQSLFVLDEPSLGLSLKTQEKLIYYLRKLRDQGNTIILVEHSEFLQEHSDEIVYMGPKAGEFGGEVLYQGRFKKSDFNFKFQLPKINEKAKYIEMNHVEIRQLKKEKVVIQKNAVNWVYGESGTGKTSVIVNVLANEVHKKAHGTRYSFEDYTFKSIKGIDDIEGVVVINSSLDKISSRSTIATYTDLGAFVRKYFANLEVSKKLDLRDGHFSSNSDLGQCLSCEGRGVKLVEMHFMEDVEFVCEECQGKKLKPYYANISDGTFTAHEAFNKPLSEILSHIKLTPKGKRIWEYFKILKLDYLSLDRTLISLSGGERQRLHLLTLLDKKISHSLIIFENLTSGLSKHEHPPLAELLHQLSGNENTVVVIDQNLFLKQISHHQIGF